MKLFCRSSILTICALCLSTSNAKASEDSLEKLLALDLEELTNIQVTVGSKRLEKIEDSPGIISVITKEDIKRYGSRTLFDIVNRFPNVDILKIPLMPTGIGLNIRGQTPAGSPNHILTLIDGRPFRESQLGGWDQALYQSFPVESIERLEMIRGPGSVLYGTNAFSGVLNIITKKAKQSENSGGYVSAGYGSFNTKLSESSYRLYNEKHDFGISAAFNYLDSAGWDYGMTDLTGFYDSPKLAHDAVSGFINGHYKNLSFSGFRGQTDTKSQGLVNSWPFGYHRQQREFLDVGYEHPIWQNWKVNLNVTYNGFENTASSGTALADENNFHDMLYEASISGNIYNNINLVAGAIYDDRNGVLEIGDSKFDEAITSGYLQVDYKPRDWLKLIGGLQLNKPEAAEVAEVSPRLGAIVNLTPQLGAKLLYGEAFRSPTASETRLDIPFIVGNPELKSETIKTTELQLFYNQDSLSTALTVYHSDAKDVIFTGANPSAPPALTFLNGEEQEYWGIELEGKAFINKNFEIQGSLTYQHGEDSETGNEDITLSPHLMLKLGGSYVSDNGYSIGMFNHYIADTVGYRTINPPTGRANPTVKNTNLLTANISVDLNKVFDLPKSIQQTTFTVYGDNLLDEDIEYPGITGGSVSNTIPGYSGRAVYGRMSIRF